LKENLNMNEEQFNKGLSGKKGETTGTGCFTMGKTKSVGIQQYFTPFFLVFINYLYVCMARNDVRTIFHVALHYHKFNN